MPTTYWVKPYDGEGGDSLDTRNTTYGPFDTLSEAREHVLQLLDDQDYGTFTIPGYDAEPGLLECWNGNDEPGCGGYSIYEDKG